MADKRRFDLFAQLLVERFPQALRVFDVAGGQGKLNEALTRLGRTVTTFDLRHKRLPVRYAERIFTLEEPCEADLVVGMHPDGATRVIIEYAAKHQLPFAVVPCCSDNSMPYNPWRRHLAELARERGFALVEEVDLPMDGRSRVVLGAFR
ncbi:hypothetical protein FGE12_22510 [Aggregicoccus sp. 17bor-14]|uniref:hypothetical protein n=1 Tax=Myxococcaceae TaxID=31 RepID=UPI00129C2EC6|nr:MULTISPECIES: hypothetical protein [Myxococcaceae]MBF5045194.1 hypothetical protein [Simulacricoccus sp. 17bor-14]MRI90935.1 hypothetical protein [Aggregicoccus sp. 17bor-14]